MSKEDKSQANQPSGTPTKGTAVQDRKPVDKGIKPTGNSGAKDNIDVEQQFVLEDVFPDPTSLFGPSVVAEVNSPEVIAAFDTNALLLPYRIGKDDLSAIGKVYRTLAKEGRLFVPARVVREFTRNRDRKLGELVSALNDRKSRMGAPDSKLSPLIEELDGYSSLSEATQRYTEARSNYFKALNGVIDQIRAWRGTDPVSKLYHEVFTKSNIKENSKSRTELTLEWKRRAAAKLPPGYKDSAKSDAGIGDYLIWDVLLQIGAETKKDLVFVTGEEKADWFIRSGNEPMYPRPELVDEYRRISSGRNIRFCSLYQVLEEMNVPADVVSDVKSAEQAANNAINFVASHINMPTVFVDSSHHSVEVYNFDLDLSDGIAVATVGTEPHAFSLAFEKANDVAVNYHRYNLRRISRLRNAKSGEILLPHSLESSSKLYALFVGEAFFAENMHGATLVGRITSLQDSSRGADRDAVQFTYSIFSPGALPLVP